MSAVELLRQQKVGTGRIEVSEIRGEIPGGTIPGPAFNCPAGAGISNQTVRDVAFISAGGDRVRVRLNNTFGTQPLAVGAGNCGHRGEGRSSGRGLEPDAPLWRSAINSDCRRGRGAQRSGVVEGAGVAAAGHQCLPADSDGARHATLLRATRRLPGRRQSGGRVQRSLLHHHDHVRLVCRRRRCAALAARGRERSHVRRFHHRRVRVDHQCEPTLPR